MNNASFIITPEVCYPMSGFTLQTKPELDQCACHLTVSLCVSAVFNYYLFSLDILKKLVGLEDQLHQKSTGPAEKSLVTDQRISG